MIIGFTGLIGAGKDTVASMIHAIDPTYEIKSFADRLKDMTSALFGWDRMMLQGTTPESRLWREQPDPILSELFQKTITPRNQLQHLGFSMKTVLNPDVWALFLKDEILKKDLKNVLITDVRSSGEINMVRSLGGLIIRIERGILPDWFSLAEQFNVEFPKADDLPDKNGRYAFLCDIHPTEWKWVGIDKPDYVIQNNATLDTLHHRVTELFSTLIKKTN